MLGVRRHGGDREVGDVGNGGQGLPPETQGIDARQLLKAAQLGGCVPLAEQGQVLQLHTVTATGWQISCLVAKTPQDCWEATAKSILPTAGYVAASKAWSGGCF